MNWSDWIAILTFGFSLWVYFKHDIKVTLTWDDESGKGVTQTEHVEDEGVNEFMRI